MANSAGKSETSKEIFSNSKIPRLIIKNYGLKKKIHQILNLKYLNTDLTSNPQLIL